MTAEIQMAGAESLLSRITSHAYVTEPTFPLDTELLVWMTEWADLAGTFNQRWYESGAAGKGMTWASNLQIALIVTNISGYLYWIELEAGDTASHLLAINTDNTISTSKRFWAFTSFSRHIRPGAVRELMRQQNHQPSVQAHLRILMAPSQFKS